jgi:type VI protein secretion system component Hcp
MGTRYFLALDGVKGDSLNSMYKGWFEVSNFDIDLTAAGGGASTAFSPLTLTLDSNTGLAPLLALAATGQHVTGATLIGVTDGAGQAKLYQLDLADVLVANVEHHADLITGAGPTLTLDYSKIELETFTPDGTGGVVPEGQFGFDLTTNTDGITVPSADPGGSVAASPQPIDYFMLIDGLNGGSLDAQHKGWFEIEGVDLDIEKLVAGSPDFATLHVTLPGDVELADVMRMAATGRQPAGGVIEGVRIEGFAGGGLNRAKVYDLTLADVGVTEVADSEGDGYGLSLEYSKIALVTNGIDATGTPTKNGEFGYDVTNHTEIAPFSLDLSPASSVGGSSPAMYFLALDGVRGDLDRSFTGPSPLRLGWFEVNSFDFDLQGVGLPEPGEKAAFSPLTVTLNSNTALTPLLAMAATGELSPPNADPRINAATLIGVAADGQTVLYRLDLAGPGLSLPITKVEDVAGTGLNLTLDFDRIELQTFAQDLQGVVSRAGDFKWNEATNSENLSTMPSVENGGIAPSPEPATYFMLIDGLNGGSTDSLHKGWFEVSNFELDLENTAPLGKPDFSSLNVTLPNEAGLADVMDLAATGGLVKGVRIEGFSGGATPAKVYELTLADVAATKVADGQYGGYSLSLDYGKIALVTRGETGTQTAQFSYDLLRNESSFNPSSLTLSPDSSGGPVTPAKYFLALDGMKGDSLNSTYKGWYEISDFDIDLDNVFAGTPGGPGGPGNPDFSPLALRLNSITGLAPLLALAATGQHLNGATLVGVTAGLQDKVYQLDLADVLVTKVEDDAAAGLMLSLDYGKIELDTFTQSGTGGVVPEGQFGFDRTTNTGGVTVPSVLPSGSVAASPQPATYFMLIDGVNGGSTDAQHRGWFEINGVDLDLAHMRLSAPGGANFSPLIVTPENEAGLAGVMDLAATGELVKGVRIEGFTGGATPAKVYELTLADVAATKVVDAEGDGYSLSLDYSKIALVTNAIDATGAPTKNGEFGYDVVNNTEIAPFSLALNPGHEPVANAQSITTNEDTATAVTLSGSDVDGDSLTFTVTSGPAHGTLSGTGANFIYTPDPDYNGPDFFTYVANDGWTDSAVASVRLTVNGGVDIAPTITSNGGGVTAALSVVENITAVTTVTATDPDAGQTLTYSMSGGVDAAKFTIDASTGALSFMTAPNFELPSDSGGNNVYDVTVQVSDGHGGIDTQAIAVTVNDVVENNHAPTVAASDQTATRGEVINASSLFSASDADGDNLLYFFYDNIAEPMSGHFTVDGAVQVAGTTFAVSEAQLAQTTFTAGLLNSDDLFVNVWDGELFSGPKEFHVNVPANRAPTATASDIPAARGDILNASSLFSASDAEGDHLLYFFYDNSAEPTSGHFTVGGAVQAAGTTFAVSGAQLAQTTFTAGLLNSDDLFVNVWDGSLYSGPKEFHIDII